MGGIGKTTLARAIYNKLAGKFEATSFVENCGEKNLSEIRSQLCKDLLRDEDFRGQGERLKRGLMEKEVLIVLDDVKTHDYAFRAQGERLEVLIEGVIKSLQPGSRILVTSRNRAVFPHQENEFPDFFKAELYNVQGMDRDESLRLFCLHAFKKAFPMPGFEGLAERVCEACGGLTLSLEVLGRHLSTTKQKNVWEEAIAMLRSNTHEDIVSRLMISYRALRKHEQEMFLDVACFLIGRRKRCAEYFWDGLVEGWRSGLQRLVDLCLVKVTGEYEHLTMHDHLRDFGRGIIEKEYKESGKCSRLWDNSDLLSQVLKSKQGLDQIRGLATSLPYLNAGLLSQLGCLRLLFLKNTRLNGNVNGLKGLQIKWLNVSDATPAKELLGLESLTLLELRPPMWKLRSPFQGSSLIKWAVSSLFVPIVLIAPIFATKLLVDLLFPPKKEKKKVPFSCRRLKKLRMLSCPSLEELPEDFGSLESLEELHVRSSEITELPSSFCQLKKLRELNMYGCRCLQKLPEDFGSLESLEVLNLSRSAITKLPSSFRQLKKLRELDMQRCGGLKKLPDDFGSLESLEELDVSESTITKLPSSFGKLKKLRELDMFGCGELKELPKDFGSLESLEMLNLSSSAITKLPSSFGRLKKLLELDMSGCGGLEELPEDFGSLESVEVLDVSESAITKLPSSFGQLKKLQKLNVYGCRGLDESFRILTCMGTEGWRA